MARIKEELIQFTSETGRAAGKIGGKVKSAAKKRAAKIRAIKLIRDPIEKERKILQLLQNREELGKEILTLYDNVVNDPDITVGLKSKVIDSLTRFLQTYYGQITKNLNVNVDANKLYEEEKERWKEWKELDEIEMKKKRKILISS